MSDAELEGHILDCGRLFQKAYAEGDLALARQWLAEEAHAIKSRSPEQVARMEEDYFSAEGERARFRAMTAIANAGGM